MLVPLGLNDDGKMVFFDFSEKAKWKAKENDWWKVKETVGRITASVYIKRWPGWVPAHGIAMDPHPNIFSGQMCEVLK